MRPHPTRPNGNHLEVTHQLSHVDGRATAHRLAERLGVTPASVTGLGKKLAVTRPPLVLHSQHRGAVLTAEGERVASEIVRHHRLLGLYLVRVLGYEWDAVHAEADRLEHEISEEFEERVSKAHGDPECDPRGDPIPARLLQVTDDAGHDLDLLTAGHLAGAKPVLDTSPATLQRLDAAGLVPGAQVTLVALDESAETAPARIAGGKDAVILARELAPKLRSLPVQCQRQRGNPRCAWGEGLPASVNVSSRGVGPVLPHVP